MAEKAGGLGALTTLARFAVPRLGRYLMSGNAVIQSASLKSQLTPILASEGDGVVADASYHALSAEGGEWTDTGVTVTAGEEVTLLAQGVFWMSKPLDIRLPPSAALWARIGDGHVFKVTSNAATVVAKESGRLSLIAAGPGVWENQQGDFLGGEVPVGPKGELDVAVLKFGGNAADALKTLADNAETPLADLLTEGVNRVTNAAAPPEGWQYLWRLGEGEVYTPASEHDDSCIHCTTHEDVGILQIPAERPLTDTLTLNWDWIAHQLPSSLPEDIEPTHDYLSIAVEFDNGLDLTYMWSAALPADTIFQCPLAWWDERETHWVIRTKKDLGKWLSEERSIRKDYERAIGGEVPAKVVQVWLIANSLFQRGTGKCDYRAIRLMDGEDVLDLC
ncbi:MAG: DUF3047 domain-containing protein [Rhodobiaceae bacterium]|nr:DUF3047 domain-containing protein [Rhodobiaceae bacterium]